MNINLELYKTFYYVAKNENITKASNELLISQPSISKAIKNLEDQLNCQLFIRSKHGVILTEEGKMFYEQIKTAMEIIESAEEKLKEVINLDYGVINIGISNTLTQKYLLPYIKEFHNTYPKIKINIITGPTHNLLNSARNGIVDFIILNLPYIIPNDFSTTTLREIHDIFVASNKFINLKDKTIKLNELNNYPLIIIAKGSNTRYFLDNYASSKGTILKPEMELASYSLVTEFTKIGFGIGYLIKEFISKELENNELFELKIDEEIPPRSIGLIYSNNRYLSKTSKEFIKFLKEKK